jgi:exonuclease III
MFCCEHWLNKYENNFFENINLNKEFNTIFYSQMIQVNNKGRPWGGSSWFFKKKIEILKHEILEDGICALEIKYKNETFTLIGVNLASMSAKLEQKIKYRSQLLILQEKVISCRRENKRFIILGDTNADITRKRYFNDEKLVEFLKTYNCKSIKNENKNID